MSSLALEDAICRDKNRLREFTISRWHTLLSTLGRYHDSTMEIAVRHLRQGVCCQVMARSHAESIRQVAQTVGREVQQCWFFSLVLRPVDQRRRCAQSVWVLVAYTKVSMVPSAWT